MAQSKSSLKQGPAKDKKAPAERSFMKNDFPLIRKALIVLIASLLSSAALVGAGSALLTKQQEGMNQAQAQLSDALNKRRQAENDQQEIQDYQPKYLTLRAKGFVGEEKRLDWMEQIKAIRESRKLLPITYEISARQVFQVDPGVSIGNLELRGSKIKLQMDLLHEGDLLNLLDDLKHKGFYTAQECTVKRVGTEPVNSQSPRLTAECALYWLSLGERTGSHGEAPNPAGP